MLDDGPASALQTHSDVLIVLDRLAASLLTEQMLQEAIQE